MANSIPNPDLNDEARFRHETNPSMMIELSKMTIDDSQIPASVYASCVRRPVWRHGLVMQAPRTIPG